MFFNYFQKFILKSKNYTLILLALFIVTGIMTLPKTAKASFITSQKLIELTNKERVASGLSPLTANPLLYSASLTKSHDMLKNNYFDHYSPYGTTPWQFIKQAGYQYLMAGENLAMDFQTSEGVHRAWMASGSHRANILNPNYENIAVAVAEGYLQGHDTTLVVQMFGKQDKTVMGRINAGMENVFSAISNIILGKTILF